MISSVEAWILLTGGLATVSCALLGAFLVLRKMSLIGDALSHAVLPGIVIAFLLSGSRDVVFMFAGAAVFGVLATILIETFHRRWRVHVLRSERRRLRLSGAPSRCVFFIVLC